MMGEQEVNPKITSMEIQISISNRFATTVITSKVKNVLNKSEETTFSVVLPDNAFISEFVMEIGGKVYKAYVKEKKEAKRIYDQAVASGRNAGHVEVNARDSKQFTVSINVEPESETIFRLTYEELLKRQHGQYEIIINIHPGQVVKDLNVNVHINESRSLRFVKTPSLRTGNEIRGDNDELNPSADIKIINSTSAVVKFNPTENQQKQFAKLLGSKEENGLAGQFVVQYDVERDPQGGEVLVRDGYFVHFFSPSELEPLQKHVVFVLDHSGSMFGRKIEQLTEAMQNILSELSVDDLFNIVRFSESASVWNISNNNFTDVILPFNANYGHLEPFLRELGLPEAVKATKDNADKAKEVVKDHTKMGRTNIIAGLEIGLFLTKRTQELFLKKYQLMIIFLTDGLPNVGISSGDQITNTVTKLNSGENRTSIFSLSFGHDADKKFLQKLSADNLGFSRHIYEASDASLQLQDFYRTISSPLLADVTFKYVDGVSDVTKNVCPILFDGSELVFAGKTSDTSNFGLHVDGICKRGSVQFKPIIGEPVSSLERLWAYLTVKQLLQERETEDNNSELSKKALDLALKYSFVTSVTSLVVVKPDDTESMDNKKAPTAFGTPFGVTTTTASTGFGGFGSTFGSAPQQASTGFGSTPQQPSTGFGSTFGAQAAAAPAFGSTSFGAPASSTPAFGSTFGQPTSTTAPTFGSGFGTSGGGLFGASTTKPSLFGTPATSASLFSTPASSAPSLFGSATTTQAPSLFGTATTSTPSLFGAGGTAAPSLFGAPTTTTPSLFGSSFGGTATTSAPNLFGGTAAAGTGTGFGLFGSTATSSAPSLFGGFGTSTTQASTGFGGFGGTTTGGFGTAQTQSTGLFGGFGAKPAAPAGAPQSALTTQQQQNQQVMASIYAINIYNDERDDILKKWNLLQACWGTGKGYYNPNLPPVEYNAYNPFYRFKAVGYNIIPEHDNAEGLVKLTFNRKYSELSSQKQVLINGIGGILGNKPNLKVIIQHIKAISDTQSEIRIVVMEKGVTGTSRKIPATDLASYLNQPTQKQQLTNVGVTSIVAYVTPSKASLEEYLRTVPLGFDPQMWKAAIADNPNPNKYMPVPIYGFSDLKARKLKQEHETGLHKAFEEKINNELAELKKKHAASVARINELKHRFLHLQHRTLRILVRQESIRKNGIAIQPEEEYLKGKLETMYAHLNVPTQFKGQLNELISTVKLMENTTRPPQPRYKLLPESQGELKEFLQLQQNGISKLVDIVKEDMRSLNIMSEGMRQILQNKTVMP